MTALQPLIRAAMDTTAPRSKERDAALKRIKWVMRSGLLYAGLQGLNIVLTTRDKATVFDARDNEERKLSFYQAVTGYKFEVEIV